MPTEKRQGNPAGGFKVLLRAWPYALTFLLAATPAGASAAAPFCLSPVHFALDPQSARLAGMEGKFHLRPVAGDAEPIDLPAKVGTVTRTTLPCSTAWEVRVEFPEAWGPGVTVTAGADPAGEPVPSQIVLWPLGRIAGSVKLADKRERLPKLLTVTTLAPRRRTAQPPPKGKLDCPIDAEGKWSCPPLPATTYDLVLLAHGFTPQYRWGLRVEPGKVGELGTIELKRGASVAGWVAVEEGAIDSNSCKARLQPLVGSGGNVQLAEKIAKTTMEVRVGKDGFFQFDAVPPGTYSLEVRQKGFAPGTAAPIEVYPRSESSLREPITLRRPFQIELAISPPLDWLDQRWKVQVYRFATDTGTFREEVFKGAADTQGMVTLPGQTPGQFKLYVYDSRENRLLSRTLNLGPSDAHQAIDLKLVTLRGTVKLGKEPLAAKLWFGGRYGGSSVALESDADGKFHGVLPQAGWWTIDVESMTPPFQVRTKAKVEAADHERATVDIVLPSTHLFGRVVMDDTGRPASQADVSLGTDQGDMEQRTDETGSFEFRGLPVGTVYAAADLSSGEEKWSSDRIVLSVEEGEDRGPVELRVRKTKQIRGIVQSARGPVAGAAVEVIPFRPVMMFGDSVRTELDGSFTGKVPASTETAAAVVVAPGFALRAFALGVGEPPRTLQIGGEGGSLDLVFPDKPQDAERDAFSVWIFQNGLPLPMNTLYQWASRLGRRPDGSGKGMSIPEVAPGEYRACIVTQAVLVQWEASGWTAPLAKCSAGQLAAGGELRLDLSASH